MHQPACIFIARIDKEASATNQHLPACRGLHVIGSQRVSIYNVTVNNDFEIPNDDGMDIDSSQDVWVSNCNVTAWDDGICVKTTLRESAHQMD